MDEKARDGLGLPSMSEISQYETDSMTAMDGFYMSMLVCKLGYDLQSAFPIFEGWHNSVKIIGLNDLTRQVMYGGYVEALGRGMQQGQKDSENSRKSELEVSTDELSKSQDQLQVLME